jgi:hypothetical protein
VTELTETIINSSASGTILLQRTVKELILAEDILDTIQYPFLLFGLDNFDFVCLFLR